MKKFNNKKAFKIQKGSTEEKTTILFPKKGSLLIEDLDPDSLKIIMEALQIAFEQGYDKALLDKGLLKGKNVKF